MYSTYSMHLYPYITVTGNRCESVARKRHDGTITGSISERRLLWDGQNRMQAISENGYVSLYWYDADGNRTVKEHLGGEAVWVNGTHAGTSTDTLTYTIYPNPYITVNGNRWTKHYYIGSERIASQTGTISSFGDLIIPDNHAAGASLGINISYSGKKQMEEDSIASMYSQLGVPYEVRHTRSGDAGSFLYLPASQGGGDAASGDASRGLQRSHPNTLGDGAVYFYTRDHLGSTLTVTDSVGATVQRMEYTPWGEVFVEQRSSNAGFSTPYLFNGKELDDETGLYYYGARYYDPKLSVWYSTDRYAEKYPFASPYNYALNNPMKYVDLHGDTINWALNYSSYMTKFKVNKLREQSIVFNTLYKILDSSPTMYNLSADDKIVQEAFKGQSNWIYNNAKGYAYGNTVVFSEIYADINTFCEEI